MTPFDFKLADASGVVHEYTVVPHGATQGERIVLSLLSYLPEPLAVLLGGLDGFDSIDDLKGADLPKLLEGLDLSQLGAAVGKALREAVAQIPTLRAEILAHTMRDGKRITGAQFDAAYQRNYLELGRALFEVCRFNGFFPGLSTPDNNG